MKTLAIAVNNPRFFLTNRLTFAKGVRDHGYRVVVLCPEGPDCEEIKKLGFEVQNIFLNRKSISPLAEIKTVLSFWRQLKALQPDIFHGFTVKCVLYGALVCRLLKVPKIVVTVTGLGTVFLMRSLLGSTLRRCIGLMYRFICRGGVKVIFQNGDDLELFTRNGWVKPADAHLIRGTGINVEEFSATPIPEGAMTKVLFPSRVLKDKGINELVAACEMLAAEGLKFKLQICGGLDKDSRSTFSQEEIDRLCKLPFIEWLGHRKDMPYVFANSHIVCLPSYREGIPLALIEACSAGRPIITTDVPGCREVVTTGINGILVPVRSADAIKNALMNLMRSPELQEKWGRNGRKKALELFDLKVTLQQNLAVYGEASAPKWVEQRAS